MEIYQKIFENPLILQKILNYFPAQSLNYVIRTNKLWRSIIQNVFEQRSRISWALLDIENDKSPIDNYLSLNYWDLIFKTCPITPNVMILCLSYNLYMENFNINGENKRSKRRTSLLNYIQSKIPEACHMLYIISDGIIGTSLIDHSIYEFESSKSFSSYMFSTDHARHPGKFDIQTLAMPKKHLRYFLAPGKGNMDLPRYFTSKTGKPFPSRAKCILFFADSIIDTRVMKKFLNHVRENYAKTGGIVISGSLVDNLGLLLGGGGVGEGTLLTGTTATTRTNANNVGSVTNDSANRRPLQTNNSVIMLFFSGSEINQAILTIVPSAVSDKIEVENCIKRLSYRYKAVTHPLVIGNTGQPVRTNSFGFMFSCIGRGKHLYGGQENLETSLFTKHFPKIPLIGLFGNGEIGYFPEERVIKDEKLENIPKKYNKNIQNKIESSNYVPQDAWSTPESYENQFLIYDNAHAGTVVERNPLPLILEEMMAGDHKIPKLFSHQFIYYYSTIYCLIVMNTKNNS